jgi:tetratricopeptide (TPR) repeat protein
MYPKGDDKRAEPLYRGALAIREKVIGIHSDTAPNLNSLAFLLLHKGVYEASEVLFKRTLDIYEKLTGTEHHNIADSSYNLDILFFNKGDGLSAAPFYQRALDIYERIVGPTTAATPQLLSTIAICQNQVALYGDVPEKNWEKATDHHRKAIDLFDRAQEPIEALNVELNIQIMHHH